MRTQAALDAEKWEHIAKAIEDLFMLEITLSDDENEDLYQQTGKLKKRLVWRALWQLAKEGRLVGSELADECGVVYGVVAKVERYADGYWVTYDRQIAPDPEYPTGCDDLANMAGTPEGAPFRPRGSDHYGELGTAALLREYAKAIEDADPEVQQLKKDGLWLTEAVVTAPAASTA